MEVELPDGTVLPLPDGATGADAAAAIGPGLARAALAVKVDGEPRDLTRALIDDATAVNGHRPRLEIITERSGAEALALIRHDVAHVLAAAMLELYPGVKISIGPAIENGFYYDFQFPDGVVVNESDFPAIEAAMRRHIEADEVFAREDVSTDEALERFRGEDQPYKVELIEDLIANEGAQTVSLYTNGPFTDLCRGPHAASTKRIKTFTLQSVAGSYWRGDANRQMLTRVYGTAFFNAKDLAAHLEMLEQARARDHRRLGRELGLFLLSELSPGMPFWQPNGTVIWNKLTELWREQNQARGYREVRTPILYDVDLFKASGHWDNYRDNMYFTDIEDRPMGLKPMNCPAHVQLFKDQQRSPSRGSSTVTSRAGRCTACCGSVRSLRTTPTSSVSKIRLRTRSLAVWTSGSRCMRSSASNRGWSSRRGP
jgi:threonyl-tRNA synthetase